MQAGLDFQFHNLDFSFDSKNTEPHEKFGDGSSAPNVASHSKMRVNICVQPCVKYVCVCFFLFCLGSWKYFSRMPKINARFFVYVEIHDDFFFRRLFAEWCWKMSIKTSFNEISSGFRQHWIPNKPKKLQFIWILNRMSRSKIIYTQL